jgi:hypothetical protein
MYGAFQPYSRSLLEYDGAGRAWNKLGRPPTVRLGMAGSVEISKEKDIKDVLVSDAENAAVNCERTGQSECMFECGILVAVFGGIN